MTRSAKAGTPSAIGSLTTFAPAVIVVVAAPLNVRVRSLPAAIAASFVRMATCAAPIASGAALNTFESVTRTRSPPSVVCMIWRNVWLLGNVIRGAGVGAGVPALVVVIGGVAGYGGRPISDVVHV